jgi:uncharacterized membrane protein YbhN (UPF0104 family)
MGRVLPLVRSRGARRAFGVLSALVAALATVLTARHFVRTGWPMHHANAWLVGLAGGLFLLSYAAKAWGWQRLFALERPRMLTLAAAGGAATVGGVAFPGRIDDVIRIAVVRRCPKARASIGAVGLSLFLLGLIDTAALTPLASLAAAGPSISTPVRVGLAVVAFAGVGAAAVILLMPRLAADRRVARLRVSSWVGEHWSTPRDAGAAWLAITLSWILRGLALFVLLHALGLGGSFALALAVLCAGAASAALPIAPAGAATQAGAGAAVLVAAGIGVEQAVAFALAAQVLVVAVGAVLVLVMGTERAGARLRLRLQPELAAPRLGVLAESRRAA